MSFTGTRKAELEETRKKIHEAKSILIVGAGLTGVETAGYLAKNFGKEKKIGIIHGGKEILPAIKGGHDKSIELVKSLGIELFLKERYAEGKTLEEKGYEYMLDCRGYRFNGPKVFMSGEL